MTRAKRIQTRREAAIAMGMLSVLLLAAVVYGFGQTGAASKTPIDSPGRGFPENGPWVSFYGSAAQAGDIDRIAHTFRIINIDADPDGDGFRPAQIAALKAGGRNRVISYLNVGSMESFRTYWKRVPGGFVSGRDNAAAQCGRYAGYPDETWMDPGNRAYQDLIVDYVAPRLAAQGVDGFFLDNMEIVEHGTHTSNGPCDDACRQGGLDLVRRLREKFPNRLIVLQNATSDVTRLGTTGGIPFPQLIDGISHEEVYAPSHDADAERELMAWREMHLRPGGRSLWIGTEDYVGSGAHPAAAAKAACDASRAQRFSPYVTDASSGQQKISYWPF